MFDSICLSVPEEETASFMLTHLYGEQDSVKAKFYVRFHNTVQEMKNMNIHKG